MPLREPQPIVGVDQLGAVHVMAVGGVSMAGLAEALARRGVPVSGCDRAESATLERLRAAGVATLLGHDPAHVANADTVLVSSAIAETNPELLAARERGARILHRSAALAALMVGRRGIGVSGTHGKTTTSAMVVQALLGRDPSYHVGSALAATGTGAAEGSGPDYVIEADESDGSFLQYDCDVVAVTNIEADHLDNWGTPAAYAAGYEAFVLHPGVSVAVLCADDPGSVPLIAKVRAAAAGPRLVTFGTRADADVRLTDVDVSGAGARARLSYAGDHGELELAVGGLHNLLDAACAYAVARVVGVDDAEARRRLGEFRGTARRFQEVARVGGVRIVDDYAHHPTEITATLRAARAAVGEGRLVVLFQPHLFTRTRDFATQFGQALAGADEIVVTDVYPAREEPIPGVTGELVATAVTAADPDAAVHYVPTLDATVGALADLVRPGDLVLTIGAGNVTTTGPRLAAALEAR